MRLFFVGAALLLSISSTAAAQSRWTVSAGPEWAPVAPGASVWGLRLRAEYDLIWPTSVFGLRLEGGARWGPTQSYFRQFGSGSYSGTEQRMDVMLGLSTALTPFPRARLTPYVTMGVYGRQMWSQGSQFSSDSVFGSSFSRPNFKFSRGDIVASLGVGLRARIAGRSLQFELRRIHGSNGMTVGTRLPY